jgi:NodT family efflux transporter outer membrane factor (OMF) lipoprotein
MGRGFLQFVSGFGDVRIPIRSWLSVAGSICLVHVLSGCILGPEKPELAIDIPPAYRHAGARPYAALPTYQWWQGFRSRELTALIEEAQQANLDIAAAVGRILQADAQARLAGAPLLPNVDLNADAVRSRASRSTRAGAGEATVPGGRSERVTYSTSLSASFEIDFWGKNRAALRAAEENAVASRFGREVVHLTTIAGVANAYFQVLAAQDRLRVARNNEASAARILTLIQQRLQAGTASELDTAQQESVVATQRAAIPLLEQQLRQNIHALAVLLGRPPEFFALRGGGMNQIAIPRVTPGLPSEVLTQRPDIRQAESLLASANADVESARAAFFPSITLTGEGGFQSSALRMLFRPESLFYNVAAGLTQPIFDGGRLMGDFDLQRGRQEELLQLYRKAIIQSFADVENALVAVQQSARRERLQREVVSASRKAFEISESRLREGTIDLVTLLNTQQALFQAEDATALARLAHLQAIVSLYQALGGSWIADPPAVSNAVVTTAG